MELLLTSLAAIGAFLFHVGVVASIACTCLMVGGVAVWLIARGIDAIDSLNVEGRLQ